MKYNAELPELPEHGGDIYSAARSLGLRHSSIYDFSTNANEFVKDITKKLIDETPYPFDRYPDSNSLALCSAIARHEKVNADNIMVGNGSSELIFLALQALAPSSVLLVGPIFMEYARACMALGIPYEVLSLSPESGFSFDRNNVRNVWKNSADLTILCTPNNPTGVTIENLEAILAVIPSSRLLVDNTYREFLWDSGPYSENCWRFYHKATRPGTTVLSLNSFTKFFNCAGIRLGYVVAERGIISVMSSLRAPWTVSAFAEEMGIKFLDYIDDYRALLPEIKLAQHHMIDEFLETGFFDRKNIFKGPSFTTMALSSGSAAELAAHLLRCRILVRVCDNIPGMPPNFVRIQVRPEEQCHVLYEALKTFRG